MAPYNHYFETKCKNMNVINVEELIIMHIYVYALCPIFCYFNSLGLLSLCKYQSFSPLSLLLHL